MKRSSKKGMLENIADAKRAANTEPAAEDPSTTDGKIAAVPPPFGSINISLHPLASFNFIARADVAPKLGENFRWSWCGRLYYVRITAAEEKAEGILITGGIYQGLHPALADLPEAAFLRDAFNGARLG